MRRFACPNCGEATVGLKDKFSANSLYPLRCSGCRAEIYPSGKQSSLWRSVQAMIVTLIVIRALIEFSWGLVFIALAIIVAMEILRLFLVPMVKLKRIGQG